MLKRKISIVVVILLVCALFVACGKEEVPANSNQAELEHLKTLQSNIQSRIDEIEVKEKKEPEVVHPPIELFEYSSKFYREASQNPSMLVDMLISWNVIEEQDRSIWVSHLNTHPDDVIDVIFTMEDVSFVVGERYHGVIVPEATEPIVNLCKTIIP